MHLQPSKEDDYTDLSCEARHEALLKEYPLRTTVQLSVMCKCIDTHKWPVLSALVSADPPGEPRIEGYEEGETIRRGQQVELVCRSKGGNPPAQLVWYRNDVQVQSVWNTKGRFSENFYKFTASPADNNAKVVCEARSVMSKTPLKTEVKLSVYCEYFLKEIFDVQLFIACVHFILVPKTKRLRVLFVVAFCCLWATCV